MSQATPEIQASIVLNVMGLRELAVYGFRSWLIQDYDRPYEVILSLFNDARPMFDRLLAGANPNCRVRINEIAPPDFFNISGANNLGLHDSTGKYVFFANSDIIYPPHFLRRAVAELNRSNAYYVTANRLNLDEKQSASLRPPETYTLADGFSSLLRLERNPAASIFYSLSPWMIRREIAMEIGGFDPRVLMAEDRDLTDRVMHYLRRRGLQESQLSLHELYGYHLHHGNTGLFDAYTQSKAVFDPREKRLYADPNSTEDVLDTPLNDREALLRTIRDTPKPPLLNQYRQDLGGKIKRRATKVWNALVYGK